MTSGKQSKKARRKQWIDDYIASKPSIEDRRFAQQNAGRRNRFQRPSTCILGADNNKLMNSHTIPRSSLVLLSGRDGHLVSPHFYTASMAGLDDFSNLMGRPKVGLDEAMTFQLVCNKHDSSYFTHYETNFNKSSWKFDQKAMIEIALKNILYELYCIKRTNAQSQEPLIPFDAGVNTRQKQVHDALVTPHIFHGQRPEHVVYEDFETLKGLLDSNDSLEDIEVFTILEEKTLDWVTPIAVQGGVSLKAGDTGLWIQGYFVVLPADTGITRILIFAPSGFKLNQEFGHSLDEIWQYIWNNVSEEMDDRFFLSPYAHSDCFTKYDSINMLSKDYALGHTVSRGFLGYENVVKHTIDWDTLLSLRDGFYIL